MNDLKNLISLLGNTTHLKIGNSPKSILRQAIGRYRKAVKAILAKM